MFYKDIISEDMLSTQPGMCTFTCKSIIQEPMIVFVCLVAVLCFFFTFQQMCMKIEHQTDQVYIIGSLAVLYSVEIWRFGLVG